MISMDPVKGMASDGGGGGGGSISVVVTTIPTSTSQSSSDTTSKRRRLSQIKLIGVGREDRCCGHWFPSAKTYHRHLADKAHTDPAHEMKLLELGMLRCLHCSLWVHVDGMNAHLRKTHGIIKVSKTGQIVSDNTTEEVKAVSDNSRAAGPNFVIKVSGHNSENNCNGDLGNSSAKSLPKTSTVKLVATPSSTLYHKIKNLQQSNSNSTGKVIVHKSMPKTLPYVNVGPRLVMKSLGPTSVVTIGNNCKILPQSSQTISSSVNGVSTLKLSAPRDAASKCTLNETSVAKALSSPNNTQNVTKKNIKVVKKVNCVKSKAKSNESSQTKPSESSTQVPASRTEASLDPELVEKGQTCTFSENIPVNEPKPVKTRRKQILKPTETELSVVNELPESLAMKVKKRGRKSRLTPEREVSRSSSVNRKAHRQKLTDCHDSENYTPKTGRQTSRGTRIRGRWNKRKRGPGRPRKIRIDESPDLSEIDSLFDETENENLENEPVVVAKAEEENIPTVELDLFTLPSLNEQMSVLLTEPKNPNFKVYASMDAIFVGDSALGDVTNQIGYVTDANNVVFVNPGHFLFPNVEDLENFVPSPILTMKGNKGSIAPVRQVWKLNVNKNSKESRLVSTKPSKISSICDLNVARVSSESNRDLNASRVPVGSENNCDRIAARVSSENVESQVPVRQKGNDGVPKISRNECNIENTVNLNTVGFVDKSKETISLTANSPVETAFSVGESIKDTSVQGNSESHTKHSANVKRPRRRSKSRSSSCTQEVVSDEQDLGENIPALPSELVVSKSPTICINPNDDKKPNNETVDPSLKFVGNGEYEKIHITDDEENKGSVNENIDKTYDSKDEERESEVVDVASDYENKGSEVGIKVDNENKGSENYMANKPVTDDEDNKESENNNVAIAGDREFEKSENKNVNLSSICNSEIMDDDVDLSDTCSSENKGDDIATVDSCNDSEHKDSENVNGVVQEVQLNIKVGSATCSCSSKEISETLRSPTVSEDLSKRTQNEIQKSVSPSCSGLELIKTPSPLKSVDVLTEVSNKSESPDFELASKPSSEKAEPSIKEEASEELNVVPTSNETSKVIVKTNIGYPRRQRRRRLRSKSAIIVSRSVVDHSHKVGHFSGSRPNYRWSQGRSRHSSESSAVNYKGDLSRHNFKEKLKVKLDHSTPKSKQLSDKAEVNPVGVVGSEIVEQVSYPHTPETPRTDMDNPKKKTQSTMNKEMNPSISYEHDNATVKQEKKRKQRKRAHSETLEIMPLKREVANTKAASYTNDEGTGGLRSIRERRPSYKLLESLAVAKQSPRRIASPRIEKEAYTTPELEKNIEDEEDTPAGCKKSSVSGDVSPEYSVGSQSPFKGRKKLKSVKSEEPFSPASPTDSSLSPLREWLGRGAKLKAQVLIQDQQAGVIDSHISPSCDTGTSKQMGNAVHVDTSSPNTASYPISSIPGDKADSSSHSDSTSISGINTSLKTPKSHKSLHSLQNREWQARGAKLKAQVMISDSQSSVMQYSEAEVTSPVFVTPPAKKIKIEKSPGSIRDIRSFFTVQKSPQKSEEDSNALLSPQHSSDYVIPKPKTPKSKRIYHQKCDIRAFFAASTASTKRKYTSSPKPVISCSLRKSPKKEKVEAVNVHLDFEGFERCSRQSGIRARSLLRLVSLLNMKRWYHLGKLPFPLDQLCVWNDELLNAKVFTEDY